ncbi:MAG: biotin--[acetyl-CoA-carboxylase] ligase [Flavobacteriaceae bacterium]|nr:biotin--[acetyl-CoA-carboxylase] ligase [Flavobacteriaceae bacterium]|tara:strand:+ start:886 stop:1635 length:750 start_codon:yes stop_codon:yes gene_type:complete
MKIIKLDAINSTNEFLNEYIQINSIKNNLLVYTFNQTKGKGQRGKAWISEPQKNLAISICVFPKGIKIKEQFILNMFFSLLILNILKSLKIPDLKIKWPNDILSGKKKICGILNEIKVKGKFIENIIIGFGINVNQDNFDNLPNASSLKLIKKSNYDLNNLVKIFIKNIKNNDHIIDLFHGFKKLNIQNLTEKYYTNLYGFNQLKLYVDSHGSSFNGIIISVDKSGVINIKKEDGSVKLYNFQEIKLII